MLNFFSTSRRCFCAFCRTPRTVYRKKHVSFFDVVLAGGASALLSFIIWQEFDPRALMFFTFGLGVAEIFVVVRFRVSIPCSHCGFDPVLYKKYPERAAARVKEIIDLRREDPMAAFSPLNLPFLLKKAERTLEKSPTAATSAVSKVPEKKRPPIATA